MSWIELTPGGASPIPAWRADPDGPPQGGVVVIQEIFGVNAHIRAVADRFAAEGFLAIAPAIFDRVEKGFDVGYDPESRARGMAIVGKLDFDQLYRDVAAAIDVVKEGGEVGIVGYCLGGSIAWNAAQALPGLSAVVVYYGGRVLAAKDKRPAIPAMLHFGEKDHGIPVEGVRELAALHPDLPVYIYPADHGFNCDHREAYDAASSALSWERTLEFLKRELR